MSRLERVDRLVDPPGLEQGEAAHGRVLGADRDDLDRLADRFGGVERAGVAGVHEELRMDQAGEHRGGAPDEPIGDGSHPGGDVECVVEVAEEELTSGDRHDAPGSRPTRRGDR